MSTITTNEFAVHLGTTPRQARKFLRSVTDRDAQPGKGSRWSIPGTKSELAKLSRAYKKWDAEEKVARAARAQKAAEEATQVVETEEVVEVDETVEA